MFHNPEFFRLEKGYLVHLHLRGGLGSLFIIKYTCISSVKYMNIHIKWYI